MRQTVVFDVQDRFELDGEVLEAADTIGAAAGLLASSFHPIDAERIAVRVAEVASAWVGLDEDDVETAELCLAVLAVVADEIARMRLALVRKQVTTQLLPDPVALARARARIRGLEDTEADDQ